MTQTVSYGLLGLVLLPTLLTDMTRGFISIRYCAVFITIALGLRALDGWGDFEAAFLSGAFAIVGTLGTYGVVAVTKKGIGFQELSLLCAVGSILGTPLHFTALIFIALVGAAQALLFLWWSKNFKATLAGVLNRKSTSPQTIPYGLSIALGSVWAIWWNVDAS